MGSYAPLRNTNDSNETRAPTPSSLLPPMFLKLMGTLSLIQFANAGDRSSFPSWICVTGYEPSEHCLNGNFKRINRPHMVESSQAYYYKYPHEVHDPAAARQLVSDGKAPPSWRIIEGYNKLTAEGRYKTEDQSGTCTGSYVDESTANQWNPEQPTWTKMSNTGKEMFEFEIFPITQELINQEMAVQKVLGNEIPLIDRTGWIVSEKIMQVMKSAKKCSQDKPKEL